MLLPLIILRRKPSVIYINQILLIFINNNLNPLVDSQNKYLRCTSYKYLNSTPKRCESCRKIFRFINDGDTFIFNGWIIHYFLITTKWILFWHIVTQYRCPWGVGLQFNYVTFVNIFVIVRRFLDLYDLWGIIDPQVFVNSKSVNINTIESPVSGTYTKEFIRSFRSRTRSQHKSFLKHTLVLTPTYWNLFI